MATIFVDESGIGPHDRRLFIGGYMALDDVWSSFNKAWHDRLAENRLTYFHMTDFKADQPPFCQPNLNRAEHTSLEHDLAQIIASHEVFGLVMMFDQDAYNRICTKFQREIFGDAKAFAFNRATYEFWHMKDQIYYNVPLRIAYGKSPLTGNLDRFVEDFEKLRIEFPNRFDRLEFVEMKEYPGVQAADMLVWEVQDHAKRVERAGGVPQETSVNMRRLADRYKPVPYGERAIRAELNTIMLFDENGNKVDDFEKIRK